MSGYTRSEAIKVVKMFPKWRKKRINRLPERERKMVLFWEDLSRRQRRAKFKTGETEDLPEDYENYLTTEK